MIVHTRKLLQSMLTVAFALLAYCCIAQENFRWQCNVERADGKWQVTAVCTVKKNCYLYASATDVTVKNSGNSEVLQSPRAVKAADDSDIYSAGEHKWIILCSREPESVTADYQGCIKGDSQNGDICLMPASELIWSVRQESSVPAAADNGALPENLSNALDKFSIADKLSGLAGQPELLSFITGATLTAPETTTDNGSSAEPGFSFWGIILLTILGGLGLNLTPCVLPMIPINLAIIGAGNGTSNRWQGFRRGAAYGIGITLAYGILGVIAAITGSGFGSLNSSSIFNWIIALIFVLLGLGMLGVYDLDFSRFSNRLSFGRGQVKLPPELTALAMGAVAALLAGACVAPVVISVVILAGRLYGEGYIFALALPFLLGFSMALPWPLLGAGMSILPPPGSWMVRVKQLFGVLILLMALYYGYLGWNLRGGAFDQAAEIDRLAGELALAAEKDQNVLIDCWASWCKNCAALEKELESPQMTKALQNSSTRLIRFRAERLSDPAVKAFMEKFQLPGLPSLILLKDK